MGAERGSGRSPTAPDPDSQQQQRRFSGPQTTKGLARRAELVAAARTVFERVGFLDARVADIVVEARVSQGTFYTYFDSKDSIFQEVARDAVETQFVDLHAQNYEPDPYERTRAALRRFVRAYRPHARIIALIEQVGTYSPEMRELRLRLREAFVERTARGIRRLQDEGKADPGVDVDTLAEVLGAMIDHTCYVWLSLGKDFDEETLIATLTTVWVRALGIPATSASPEPDRDPSS